MGEKIPSQIRRIDLDYATFENTNEYVEEPTFVNFFFGNNGSGKSTIAKAIKSGAGVTYAPGKSPADYLVYLYDEDYINDNFHSYHGMPGVYTLNSENVEAQKQIDAQHVKLSDARKARDTATEEKTKRENARASLQKRFQQECWDSAKALRTEFDKTQDGKRRTKQFSEAVLAAKPLQEEPTESDIKDLRQLYQSAYSSNARQYPLFAKVEDTGILDAVEDLDLLSLAIVNISDTPYAEFIKEIDATQWVREGYASYAGKAKGKCPFCRQKLPDNFEKTLSDSFDEKYEISDDGSDSFQIASEEAMDDYSAKMAYIEELLGTGALTASELAETVKMQQMELTQLKKENTLLKSKLLKAAQQGFKV